MTSQARAELLALPRAEQQALLNGLDKLRDLDIRLGYPTTSKVQGARDLRELRPRAGRSAWRAFYRRIGDVLVVGAIGPEAHADPRGFRAAVATAVERLDAIEEEDDD